MRQQAVFLRPRIPGAGCPEQNRAIRTTVPGARRFLISGGPETDPLKREKTYAIIYDENCGFQRKQRE